MSFITDIFTDDPPQINVPGKSPEELALLREQTGILQSQNVQLAKALKEQDLLRPLLFEELGITEQRDAAGNLTGYSKRAQTPEEAQQAKIEQMLRDRSIAALEGNLPVDPSLERELVEGEKELREAMFRQLGPGWETSSPGIEAIANFNKRAEELRQGARTAQLTLSEQLAGAREARTAQGEQATFENTMDLSSGVLPFLNTGLGVAQGFSGPLSSLAGDRAMQFQANSTMSQLQAQQDAALMGGLGNIAGMAAFAPTNGTLFGKLFS